MSSALGLSHLGFSARGPHRRANRPPSSRFCPAGEGPGSSSTTCGGRAAERGGYLSVVEVSGFNHWLLKFLTERGCGGTIVVQPGEQAAHKTDRRDASAMSEILWINRDRIRQGLPVRGLRRI